jgi:hypothetical protein
VCVPAQAAFIAKCVGWSRDCLQTGIDSKELCCTEMPRDTVTFELMHIPRLGKSVNRLFDTFSNSKCHLYACIIHAGATNCTIFSSPP